jgi:ATP-dependent protease ClpP protease subunit
MSDPHQLLMEACYLVKHGGATAHARALVLVRASNFRRQWFLPGATRNGIAEVMIFGSIPDDDSLLDHLQRQCATTLLLRLDSHGGDIHASMRLARWLQTRDTIAVVESQCKSAAVNILLGCRRRIARRGAAFMVHSARSSAFSMTAPEHRAAAADLDRLLQPLVQFIAEHTQQPAEVVRGWLSSKDDIELNSEEALQRGLIQEIIPDPVSDNGGNAATATSTTATPLPPADDSLARELAVALRQLRLNDPAALQDLLRPLMNAEVDAIEPPAPETAS